MKKKESGTTKVSSKKSAGKKGSFSTIRDAFSSMGKASQCIAGDIGKTRRPPADKQRENQKLDRLLDQSVQGHVSDIRSLKRQTLKLFLQGNRVSAIPFQLS